MSRPRSIRVSDEDWARLADLAAEHGLDRSSYLLACGLHPDGDPVEVARLRAALDEIGAELVSLTRLAARLRGA